MFSIVPQGGYDLSFIFYTCIACVFFGLFMVSWDMSAGWRAGPVWECGEYMGNAIVLVAGDGSLGG